MTDTLAYTTPLRRWQSDRGTYHMLTIADETAEAIAMHERLHRLEYGARRGFGSVKCMARIGATEWKTSVFPSKDGEWWLLVGKKVMRAEDLAEGDPVPVELQLL